MNVARAASSRAALSESGAVLLVFWRIIRAETQKTVNEEYRIMVGGSSLSELVVG